MLKVFDYQCPSCAKQIEFMKYDYEPNPTCDDCNKEMERQVAAPKGYVKGSHTPVKQ